MIAVKATPLEFYPFSKAKGVMRTMIHAGANNPAIIKEAFNVVEPVRSGGYVDEAKAIFEFVRDEIKYRNDVHGEDIYREPALTLMLKAGDCNNKVVLGCSMAKAIGFPTRMVFVFRKMDDNFPFHVLYEIDVTKGETSTPRWVSCETIPTPGGLSSGPSRYMAFGERPNVGFSEHVEVD